MQRKEARDNKAAEPQPISRAEAQLIWRTVLDAASVSEMPPEALARSLVAARRAIDAVVIPEPVDAS